MRFLLRTRIFFDEWRCQGRSWRKVDWGMRSCIAIYCEVIQEIVPRWNFCFFRLRWIIIVSCSGFPSAFAQVRLSTGLSRIGCIFIQVSSCTCSASTSRTSISMHIIPSSMNWYGRFPRWYFLKSRIAAIFSLNFLWSYQQSPAGCQFIHHIDVNIELQWVPFLCFSHFYWTVCFSTRSHAYQFP